MSAWVVDQVHIDLLTDAVVRENIIWRDSEGDWVSRKQIDRDEIGRTLWLENIASVAYRYLDDGPTGRPGAYENQDVDLAAALYSYTDRGYQLTAAEILKAVSCYEYQSCEHPGWEDSEAYRIVTTLYHYAADSLSDGPWGWDESELASRPKTWPLFRV